MKKLEYRDLVDFKALDKFLKTCPYPYPHIQVEDLEVILEHPYRMAQDQIREWAIDL